jgi:hypothetical protein
VCSQPRIRNFGGSKSWRGNGGDFSRGGVLGFRVQVTSGACLRFTLGSPSYMYHSSAAIGIYHTGF